MSVRRRPLNPLVPGFRTAQKLRGVYNLQNLFSFLQGSVGFHAGLDELQIGAPRKFHADGENLDVLLTKSRKATETSRYRGQGYRACHAFLTTPPQRQI